MPFTDVVCAELSGCVVRLAVVSQHMLVFALLAHLLSRNRKVTVGTYRGNVNVSIREFYEKDGLYAPCHESATMPPL